ncbi:MAG: hypothetical protein ABIZ56_11315 [Chthoniobacteraceae bacterium]
MEITLAGGRSLKFKFPVQATDEDAATRSQFILVRTEHSREVGFDCRGVDRRAEAALSNFQTGSIAVPRETG